MLIVTTVEFGNPVILFIFVISNDRLLHGLIRVSLGQQGNLRLFWNHAF